ncbi:MAG: hypothetical protein Q7R95_05965, partial [bacterium]|nr:hypothetical protein [bacterium]
MSFYSKFQKYSLPILENGVKLPSFDIDNQLKEKMGLDNNCSDYQFLLALCLEGIESKIGGDNPKYEDYQKRMNSELQVFNELGFCSYLLITWDIINFCKKNKIAIGRGRGSAGNSLVLFLIGVTQIDSLALGLYFERFLNKIRAKYKEINGIKYYSGSLLFDIDLDLGDRKPLIKYLDEKYKGKIAKLPTVITYTTKTLIKEVSKYLLEVNEEKANEISDSIPLKFNKPESIENSLKESKDFEEFSENNPEVIKIAKKIYEQWKFTGVHPSAWVITADPIDKIFPLRLTKDGELCTCYTMDDSLDLAIKIDLLSLRCATLIDRVCELVNIKPEEVNINDPLVYNSLQKLETPHGLFQIESEANYRVLKAIKPKNLEQLMAVVSLVRPGCSQFISVYKDFLETGKFQSAHPFFDDVLKETAGIPIYQENLLRMANKIGFSLAESETIRKMVGKRLIEEMAEWEQKVKDKIKENNLDPKIGEILWKIMDDSKSYSFNAGHAAAYASMCAVTTYLKFKYPKEFFLVLLNLTKDEPDSLNEIASIQDELKYFNLKLLGPDIMKSGIDFSIEGNNLRFGLGNIKGIAQKSFEKLQNFKHDYPNKLSIFCSAEESGIGVGILSALIMSGAMNNYISESRTKSVLEAQTWSLLTKREKTKILEIAKDFDYKLFDILKFLKAYKNEKDKLFIKESRVITIRKKYDKYRQIYDQNNKHEKLAQHFYEKSLIGYCYSHKLSAILREYYGEITDIQDIKGATEDEKLTICGEISEIKYWKARNEKKTDCFKATINDTTGSIELLLFNDRIQENELQNGGKFEKGWIVVSKGRKKG